MNSRKNDMIFILYRNMVMEVLSMDQQWCVGILHMVLEPKPSFQFSLQIN
jgi:hypothetical protein